MNRVVLALVVATLALVGPPTLARPRAKCEFNLGSSGERWVGDLVLNPRGERACARQRVSFHGLRDVARARGLSLLEYAPGRWLTLAFPESRRDRPVLLRGIVRRDTLVADEVVADPEEKFYYRALARLRNLDPLVLEIERPLLGRRDLVVDGGVRVKLELKHDLAPEDVVEFLNTVSPAIPILEPTLGRYGHLEIDGTNGRGIHFRAAFEVRDDDRLELVTAFRIR